MTDREKINMAIAKLQAAGDIALVHGDEWAKIPAVDALDIADLLEGMSREVTLSAQKVGKVRTTRCPHCGTLLVYRGFNTCPMCGWEVNWDE